MARTKNSEPNIVQKAAATVAYAGPMLAAAVIETGARTVRTLGEITVASAAIAFEKVGGAMYYLAASKEEKAAIRENARHEQEQADLMRAFIEEAERLHNVAFRTDIMGHPAAPSVATLGPAPEKSVEQLIVALHAASCMLQNNALREEHVIFSAHSVQVGKNDAAGYLKNRIQDRAKVSAPQAEALWNWIHALAVSGEAPHLFPNLALSPRDDGTFTLASNIKPRQETGGKTLEELAYDGWRADREAAEAKRSPGIKPAAPKL